jgi:hypothetical protein
MLLILGVISHQYAFYLRHPLKNLAMLGQMSRYQYGLEANQHMLREILRNLILYSIILSSCTHTPKNIVRQ